MKPNRRLLLIPLIASGLYVVWAIIFIYRSSFIAINGERYFSLFDDAMISMRYAWNLAHGHGLVWNPGEQVEGYSNLLMTILMSLAALMDKRSAVLLIQAFGIPTVLVSAFVARWITLDLYRDHDTQSIFADLAFLSILLYYPLSYWALMGMETGLLTLLILMGVGVGLRWLKRRCDRMLYTSAILMGLAFLTRNEALLLAILLFGYLFLETIILSQDHAALSIIMKAGLVYLLFVIIQVTFRWIYYGQLVPNTYVLKIAQIPFTVRINDGLLYNLDFLRDLAIPFGLSLFAILFTRKRQNLFLFSVPLLLIAYQMWTGGDAFARWRFLIPAVPFLFIASFAGIEKLAGARQQSMPPSNRKVIFISLTVASILLANLLFIPELLFLIRIPEFRDNAHNVDVTIAINELTSPYASIGVFTAGALPYYSDRYAIDFLGKADPYIANLTPHLPPKVTWFQVTTMPGHNKYDLNYSIKKLQPTYIQRFYWGEQNIRNWALDHYVKLEYHGKNGDITLILLKNSPLVYWEKGELLP